MHPYMEVKLHGEWEPCNNNRAINTMYDFMVASCRKKLRIAGPKVKGKRRVIVYRRTDG